MSVAKVMGILSFTTVVQLYNGTYNCTTVRRNKGTAPIFSRVSVFLRALVKAQSKVNDTSAYSRALYFVLLVAGPPERIRT